MGEYESTVKVYRLGIAAYYIPLEGDSGRIRDEFTRKLYNTLNECNPGQQLFY